jgi:YidC/Oxa1 family membrane protein insertase
LDPQELVRGQLESPHATIVRTWNARDTLTLFFFSSFDIGRANGAPTLGWEDTIAFLSLPLFLVVSQYVSMQLMQPKTDDPAQQQSNLILKLLPLMIGWFSLNVPAALGIYWVTNNIITTATSVIIKNTMKAQPVSVAGGSGSSSRAAEPPTIFSPPREKPAGFGTSSSATAAKAIDAEVVPPKPKVEVEKKVAEPVVEEIAVEDPAPSAEAGEGANASEEGSKKKAGKTTRRKKRKN